MKSPLSGFPGSWALAATVSGLTLSLATVPVGAAAQSVFDVRQAEAEAAPALSLEDALRRAGIADPALAGIAARTRAGDAAVRQADVRPNPTVGLMVENFPAVGGDIIERMETTLSYEQQLERGGDRAARVGLARREADLVQAQADVRRLDRLEEVQTAWVDALAAQEALAIARERLDLAEGFQVEVSRRVDMARDPLFAGARSEAELAQAQIDFDQAEIQFRLARVTLSRFWSGSSDFSLDRGQFEDTSASRIPAGDVAAADLAVFAAQRDVAEASVRVEQARAVPDATVSVGVRHFWDGQDLGLVVGGSIPLGRYDRNQGAIDRARAEGLAALADREAYRQERDREIARLQVVLSSRAMEARRIAEETLPQAERAVRLVREGFNRGGFTYNDVITAQTALLSTRNRRVEVLTQFHRDRARLDRLTGAHADLIGLETQQ